MDADPKKPSASKLPTGDARECDGDLIEGGDVMDLRDLEVKPPHRETTARLLAVMLISLLGGSMVLHYVTLAIFVYSGKSDEADRLGTFFNSWLPAITALVGSATTYYFTKDKR